MVFVNSISIVFLVCVAKIVCHILPTSDSGILDITTTDIVEDTCDNPEYETIKERLLRNYDSFEELYRLPPFAASSSLPKFSRGHDSYYSGSREECTNLQVHANSHGGRTCPSQVVSNRDSNRVPCVMKEHKCVCRHCLIPHSLRNGSMNNGCQPIRHYIPVMRRTTDLSNEGDEWSYVLEPYVVGCTCAYPAQVFSAH